MHQSDDGLAARRTARVPTTARPATAGSRGPTAADRPARRGRQRAAAAVTGRGRRRPGGPPGRQLGGAGESGLSRLLELHAFNAAGDAALTVSLAGTLFFTAPSDQARGQVALFLGITMLPFAVVAPLIGPFLDRFRRGRRWAIGITLAVRALGCWSLASAVANDSPGCSSRRSPA